jgi:hypothetical protein
MNYDDYQHPQVWEDNATAKSRQLGQVEHNRLLTIQLRRMQKYVQPEKQLINGPERLLVASGHRSVPFP